MEMRSFWCSLLLLLAALSLLPARATVDRPVATNLVGTAYHDGGWYSNGTTRHSDGYLLFDNNADSIQAPRYSSPVRKIILNVRCSSATIKRDLLIKPFVGGVETEDPALIGSVTSKVVSTVFTPVSFDFNPEDGIDSFRLAMQGSSGTFGVDDLIVFWGEKTDDEDEILLQFARQLSVPTGLRAEDFTATSLKLAAERVDDAFGYAFELFRLAGTPRTECREDFADAPDLSGEWTYGETNNVTLGEYGGRESGNYPDAKTAEDDRCLQIVAGKGAGDVKVEIVSPVFAAPVRECSFVSKCASAGSDAITVYGRGSVAQDWVALTNVLVSTTKTWTTNAVPAEAGIVQVKFVFTAEKSTCKNCGLDTLRVVYGGDEARTAVKLQDGGRAEDSLIDVTGLETGRYAFRVKALGGTAGQEMFRDSPWSEEGIVDLAWADIEIAAPENVSCRDVGGSVEVTWDAVTGADCYVIGVVSEDGASPDPVRVDAPRTSVTVPVSALGEYSVVVEARSPAGKSVQAAAPVAVTVGLSKPTGLTVEVPDAETINVKWDAVPLAESYRVEVYELVGDVETVESDYTGLPNAWPADWTHEIGFTKSDYFWSQNKLYMPRFRYRDAWFATGYFDKPITELVLSYAGGKEDVLGEQSLKVDVSSSREGDDWENLYELRPPSTSVSEERLTFEASRDVRRIRFYATSTGPSIAPDIKFGKFTMTLGEIDRREVKSISTVETSVSVGGLSTTGRYVVTLMPLPGGGDDLTVESGMIDIATMKPREAVPFLMGSAMKKGAAEREFAEDFSVLATLTKATSAKEIDLPNWQFFKGDGETETLLFAAADTPTSGGVYAILDNAKSEGSAALGTLATGKDGAAIGIAFSNDCPFAATAFALTFDSVQRTFKAAGKSYVFEYLVTAGETRIDTEGEWVQVEIDETAPLTADAVVETGTDCRRNEGVPVDLDVTVEPGQALLLRWRDVNRASSPLMGIDNVKLTFRMSGQKGFGIIIR